MRLSRTSVAGLMLVVSLGLSGCGDSGDANLDVPETVAPGEGGEGGGEGEGEGGAEE